MGGATMRDVSANKWVRAMAAHLKQSGKLFVPNCTELMKQSHGNQRAPENKDWFFYRCAAVLRRIYVRPGTGYGGMGKASGRALTGAGRRTCDAIAFNVKS